MSRLLITLGLATSLLLASCQTRPVLPYSGDLEHHHESLSQLSHQGVIVIETGDTLQLILPGATFFVPQTNELVPEKQHTLELLSQVVASYHSGHASVTDYSTNIGTDRDQKRQTKDRAHIVASYLWNDGLHIDDIKTKALGNQHKVASNTAANAALNSRVVVQVR